MTEHYTISSYKKRSNQYELALPDCKSFKSEHGGKILDTVIGSGFTPFHPISRKTARASQENPQLT